MKSARSGPRFMAVCFRQQMFQLSSRSPLLFPVLPSDREAMEMKSAKEKRSQKSSSSPKGASISDLPETVLLHIISFLPINDAISTSFLSKAWRNLWTYLPSLSFDQNLIISGSFQVHLRFFTGLRTFTSFVDQALQRHHHASLRTLSIVCNYDNSVSHHVDKWLQIASRTNIQRLELHFSGCPVDCHCLPIFSSTSPTIFSLPRCPLVSSSNLIFLSLRTLSLHLVTLTDEFIIHLIAGCPELENLMLECFDGIRHLNISSSRLKNLTLNRNDLKPISVEIDAPNLILLKCRNFVADDYSFEDVSSLIEAHVKISECPRYHHLETCQFDLRWKITEALTPARRLAMQYWWGEHLLWKILHRQKILPYHVEYLDLATDFSQVGFLGLAVILKHSPNLGTIIVRRAIRGGLCVCGGDLETYFEGGLPQLKIFKIYSPGACEKEIALEVELVKLLLKHGTTLKEMILSGWGRSKVSKEYYDELQNFPRSSKDAKISFMD